MNRTRLASLAFAAAAAFTSAVALAGDVDLYSSNTKPP